MVWRRHAWSWACESAGPSPIQLENPLAIHERVHYPLMTRLIVVLIDKFALNTFKRNGCVFVKIIPGIFASLQQGRVFGQIIS